MKAILATVLLIVLMNVSSENEINDTVIIEGVCIKIHNLKNLLRMSKSVHYE